MDFFEDELVSLGYDWKKLIHEYMFGGTEPLINSVASQRA